jgi:hypothetical protein
MCVLKNLIDLPCKLDVWWGVSVKVCNEALLLLRIENSNW